MYCAHYTYIVRIYIHVCIALESVRDGQSSRANDRGVEEQMKYFFNFIPRSFFSSRFLSPPQTIRQQLEPYYNMYTTSAAQQSQLSGAAEAVAIRSGLFSFFIYYRYFFVPPFASSAVSAVFFLLSSSRSYALPQPRDDFGFVTTHCEVVRNE